VLSWPGSSSASRRIESPWSRPGICGGSQRCPATGPTANVGVRLTQRHALSG
jgi:hypothetical protein